MRHRVDAGRGGHHRRHRDGQRRVDDRDVGEHLDALGRDLVHRRRVGDQRAGADLAAGAGGRRDLGERDAGASGARFGPEMSAQALVAGHQDRDELGEIHGAAAAEADHGVGAGRLGGGDRGLEVRQVGLGLHLAEERGVGQAEDVEARRVDLVGDDEGAPRAGGGEPGGERLDLAGAEADDARALHLDGVLQGQHGRLLRRAASRRAFWTSGSGSRPAASRRRV